MCFANICGPVSRVKYLTEFNTSLFFLHFAMKLKRKIKICSFRPRQIYLEYFLENMIICIVQILPVFCLYGLHYEKTSFWSRRSWMQGMLGVPQFWVKIIFGWKFFLLKIFLVKIFVWWKYLLGENICWVKILGVKIIFGWKYLLGENVCWGKIFGVESF